LFHAFAGFEPFLAGCFLLEGVKIQRVDYSLAQDRDRLLTHLRTNDIHAVFHYVPLHTSPMGQQMGYNTGHLPITEDVSERLIRLPCYFELTREEQDRVVDEIYGFFGHSRPDV
jgi:dTDP-4-amino-4,6-dideoxygalactose transaminase